MRARSSSRTSRASPTGRASPSSSGSAATSSGSCSPARSTGTSRTACSSTRTERSSSRLDDRTRLVRRLRIVVVALVIGYFFLPYDVQAWIPVWLPFLAALGVEAQFFVGGYLAGNRAQQHAPPAADRGPQARDLAELGWEPEWEDDEFASGDAYWLDERRPYLRHAAEALVALAIVGGILFYAVRPHGWNAVSEANRARAEAVFSHEATA